MKPLGIEAVRVAGVTTIELNVAAVTVKVTEPDLPLKPAVMTEVPSVMPVVRPEVLSTVATPGVPELQVTELLMSMLVPSE